MLGGDDNRGGTHRAAIDIPQRDLALGIRLQTGDRDIVHAAQFADPAQDEVRVVERGRHQRRRFGAGIAEHDALVARAFVLVTSAVHTGRDIDRLRMQVHGDIGGLPGEAGLIVADVLDRHPRQMGEVFVGDGVRPTGFTGKYDAVGRHQGFAGHAGIRVGGEEGVNNGVADPVGDLVGMAFRNRFGREQIFALVAHAPLLG